MKKDAKRIALCVFFHILLLCRQPDYPDRRNIRLFYKLDIKDNTFYDMSG